jgi:hypothetical protein
MCPYTRATGLKNGWMWTIPLWDKKSHGYVFSDSYTSINDAEIEFRQTLGLKDTDECKVIKFKNGYLDRSWIKNCVAIGLSSCFIEPLESTGIALSINQIERLLALFDKGYIKQVDKDIYNDLNIRDTLRIKSFIRNHFFFTVREDSEYWKDWKYNQTCNKDELELYKFALTGLVKPKESQSKFFPDNAFLYISEMHKVSNKFNSFITKHSLHNPNVAQITLPPEYKHEKEEQTMENIKAEVKLAPNHYDFVKKNMGA